MSGQARISRFITERPVSRLTPSWVLRCQPFPCPLLLCCIVDARDLYPLISLPCLYLFHCILLRCALALCDHVLVCPYRFTFSGNVYLRMGYPILCDFFLCQASFTEQEVFWGGMEERVCFAYTSTSSQGRNSRQERGDRNCSAGHRETLFTGLLNMFLKPTQVVALSFYT